MIVAQVKEGSVLQTHEVTQIHVHAYGVGVGVLYNDNGTKPLPTVTIHAFGGDTKNWPPCWDMMGTWSTFGLLSGTRKWTKGN